jgi:hypothetical protein
MSTPESKMKWAINSVLANYKGYVYTNMPVPTGYGVSALDYLGFCRSTDGEARGFAIEAKRPRGKPTPRQQGVIERMEAAGARVFVINSPETLEELNQWLAATTGSGVMK